MKYSYSWLKELSGTKRPPEKVVEDLTFHSFEIESLEKSNENFGGVVVGKILEIKKHPNADKLQLVKIDVGAIHESPLDVVCGAWNIKVGDKVPVALVGTVLPNGMAIKEAEIRGEKSFGMLCAEDELGLGEDHSGIIILPGSAKIGDPIDKYLSSKDSIIEIKVLPDRAHDALSHVGVAREISILEKRKFSAIGGSAFGGDYDFDGLKITDKKRIKADKSGLKVQIKDKDLCYRYIGAVMTDVKIKESPSWMKERLKVSGIKSINNVVDATNYIMLELGNPLHAFDADKLKTQNVSLKATAQNSKVEIVVRRAKKNEKIELLDSDTKELNNNDLLITNGETPLALAGIMGGKKSGINENTKTVVLEAASFNATNIRKSRTRLNVRSESSDRFEKDIDPNLAEKAMVRLIEILEHTADAKLEKIVDEYPKKVLPWKVKLDLEYVNSLLGENISEKEIVKILMLLGINIEGSKKKEVRSKTHLNCAIPTYRIDLRTQEDLIEEIGRIWGYEKVKEQVIFEANAPAVKNEQIFFERKIQDILVGLAYDEVYNYSFYSRMDADKCGLGGVKHLELANPMSPEQDLVRVSLLPNILKNVRENLKHFKNFGIFEEAKVYNPKEQRVLMIAKILDNDKNYQTFSELKGSIEDLLEELKIKNYIFSETKTDTFWQEGRVAEIKVGNETIGKIGEVEAQVLAEYKIKNRLAVAEFDLETLKKLSDKIVIFKALNKFPSSIRDISMIDKNGVKVAQIISEIRKLGRNLIQNVELFDIFEREGEKSLAFHIEFNAGDRTLEGKEIDEVMEKITSSLERELGVEVRK